MDCLHIDTQLTFDPNTLLVNQPLKLTNQSEEELVFKIKTNHKNLVSMTTNHGFLKPFEKISIQVKIVQKVEENLTIKLQVNWAKVTPQIKAKNDSKMATVSRENIFKNSFSIIRKAEPELTQTFTIYQTHEQIPSVFPEQKKTQQYNKFSSFQHEAPKIQKHELSPKIQQKEKLVTIQRSNQQKDIFESTMGQTRKLQIVAEEDEQDHQKEIEQVKNQQLEAKRKLDQTKVKVTRLNQQIKSKEIISFKYLTLLIVLSFFLGNLLKYLVF